jgi:hypothetical protein
MLVQQQADDDGGVPVDGQASSGFPRRLICRGAEGAKSMVKPVQCYLQALQLIDGLPPRARPEETRTGQVQCRDRPKEVL